MAPRQSLEPDLCPSFQASLYASFNGMPPAKGMRSRTAFRSLRLYRPERMKEHLWINGPAFERKSRPQDVALEATTTPLGGKPTNRLSGLTGNGADETC